MTEGYIQTLQLFTILPKKNINCEINSLNLMKPLWYSSIIEWVTWMIGGHNKYMTMNVCCLLPFFFCIFVNFWCCIDLLFLERCNWCFFETSCCYLFIWIFTCLLHGYTHVSVYRCTLKWHVNIFQIQFLEQYTERFLVAACLYYKWENCFEVDIYFWNGSIWLSLTKFW